MSTNRKVSSPHRVKQQWYRVSSRRTLVAAVAGSTALVAVILAVLILSGVQRELLAVMEWIQRHGAWSAILFILVMAAVVVLLVPGIFFTTGAGFVFGIAAGTVYVVLGTTLGAALAFLIARYLAGARARRYVLAHQRINAFSREAAQHDFSVVLLTRLIPFFPGKLSNYVFGLTEFSFPRYVAASAIGFIPFSLHNVYLGSLAADLTSLSVGTLQRTPWQWAWYGLGFTVVIVTVVFFSRLAKHGLDRIDGRESEDTGASP